MFFCCGSKQKSKKPEPPSLKQSYVENVQRVSMNDIYHIEIPQEIDENDLPIQPEELNVELEGQNSASNRSQHDNTPGPPSVNREPSISKGPRRVAVDSREIVQLGISTVERLADQMVARYNQDAMLEEFMSNVESPGGLAAQKVPNSVAMDKLNPLLAKSNNQLPKVMTESTCRERRKKAIKSKLSTIKSLFCKEIISDIIYDNKEKDLKKLDTIPRSLFMLKGKAIMRHLFSFMDIEDKTNLLLAIKLKVLTNKDSNLLFLCLVKTALGFDLPQLLKVSAWHNYEGKMLREVISTNLDSDLLLRYISLFINLDQIDLKKPYEGWLALKYEKVNEINKDLTRTFPDFFNTEQRRELLKDVLVAIGNSCPNIGYVQGINAVTGAIMSYFVGHRIPDVINTNPALIQQLTFTIVKFMLERRSLTLMYERSLYGFTLLCLEIKLWIKVLHPDLYLYLVRVRLTKEESCFDYNLVLSRWVLNLFTTVYPVDFVMVVICQIMLEGLTAIIKLSIAMLGYWEHKLDSEDPDELYTIICKKDYSTIITIDNYAELMLRYKLDNRVLVQIEESFKINRDNANDLLYIRKLDTKGEMYYLEKKLSIGVLEIDPRASMLGANKQQQSTIKLNNRESTNTKEASEMVNELETPGKFMGWLLA